MKGDAGDQSSKLPKAWRVSASKNLFKDRWLDVRADDCIDPRGVEIKPFYVLTYLDWVQVVAITADEKLVMVRQYRHGARMVTRELPSGAIDSGDVSPVEAGARELLEETGYACERLRLVGDAFNNPSSCTNRVFAVLGEGARKIAEQKLDATEDIVVELIDVQEAVRIARSGGLHHGAQIASLFMALAAREDANQER